MQYIVFMFDVELFDVCSGSDFKTWTYWYQISDTTILSYLIDYYTNC